MSCESSFSMALVALHAKRQALLSLRQLCDEPHGKRLKEPLRNERLECAGRREFKLAGEDLRKTRGFPLADALRRYDTELKRADERAAANLEQAFKKIFL